MQFRPQENIRMSLDESLKALSEKKKQQIFIARLEARFIIPCCVLYLFVPKLMKGLEG